MDAMDFFIRMLPFYILGAVIFISVYRSEYKNLLRVNIKAIGAFLVWMIALSIYRFTYDKSHMTPDDIEYSRRIVDMLPWQTTLFVPWEDLAHNVPLAIFALAFKDRKYLKILYYPLMVATMISFGSGHTYQGLTSAILLSLYIPFGVRLGTRYGFGTMMIMHIMYDFITIMTVRMLVG